MRSSVGENDLLALASVWCRTKKLTSKGDSRSGDPLARTVLPTNAEQVSQELLLSISHSEPLFKTTSAGAPDGSSSSTLSKEGPSTGTQDRSSRDIQRG
jgi:hypothetical protein